MWTTRWRCSKLIWQKKEMEVEMGREGHFLFGPLLPLAVRHLSFNFGQLRSLLQLGNPEYGDPRVAGAARESESHDHLQGEEEVVNTFVAPRA